MTTKIFPQNGILKGSLSHSSNLTGKLSTALPDGGYERGYADGYDVGNTDGYDKGHTEGVEQGYADGVADSEITIDALIENNCTKINNDRVTNINQCLCCQNTNLKEVSLPNVETIGAKAFQGCTGITEIFLPKCTHMGDYAFQSCSNMTKIDVPELKSMGSYALQSTSILHAVFPKLEVLGTAHLYGCWRMHTCDLYVCTSISSTTFPYSSALNTLILRSPVLCVLGGGNSFQNTPIAKGTGCIYVPKNLIEQYKSATNWSTYASQFRAIEDYPDITGGNV